MIKESDSNNSELDFKFFQELKYNINTGTAIFCRGILTVFSIQSDLNIIVGNPFYISTRGQRATR